MHVDKLSDTLFSVNAKEDTTVFFNPLGMESVEVSAQEAPAVEALITSTSCDVLPHPDTIQKLNAAHMLPLEAQIALGLEPEDHRYLYSEPEPEPFDPTQISVFYLNLTAACNLGCVYCHSNIHGRNQHMSPEVLDASLKLIESSLRAGTYVSIFLLGEGENLMAPMHVRRVCDQVLGWRADGLSLDLFMVTNATLLTQEIVDWMAPAMDSVTVSWDGDQQTMDQQRVTRDGGSCYAQVIQGCQILREAGVSFGIRMTATAASISRLPEFVRTACLEVFDGYDGSITVDPQQPMGKGDVSLEPDIETFNSKFWEAREIGKQLGIEVNTQLIQTDPRLHFCATPSPAAVISIEGGVSACSRANSPHVESWEAFQYGQLNETTGQFEFDIGKIQHLRSLAPSKFPECDHCFMRYHCTGGCYSLRQLGRQEHTCKLTKRLGAEFFVRYHRLSNEKKSLTSSAS